ncbi:MAG TPA: crosslink repair DNA glycosylase YcaQ family protein [Terriglobia bacterium]|nr:crosslink repair DNA glycosylase YcaQ family protein [Terriglobia bacterium]
MHRQFLDRPFGSNKLLDLINSIGWIYSPGCSTPYLSLWARLSSFKTEDLDKLVFDERKLVQLETLRGCTMLVPRNQAAVALRIRPRTYTELAKQVRQQMPVTDAEMDKLKTKLIQELEGGTRTSSQLDAAVPRTLIKDFPPELKRIGFINSLSLALNLLKEEGRIIKIQTRKRLDSTEYSYILLSQLLPDVDPFAMRNNEAWARLAAQYFKAESPARSKDFAWWAGINVTDAIKGIEEVKPKLVAVAIEGSKDEYLIPEPDVDEFYRFSPEDSPSNLIPYRDTYLKGQREIVDRFLGVEHADKPFSRWKGKLINDPIATVVRNGQVVGVWEWNESTRNVDLLLFETTPKPVEKALRKRAADLADFIRKDLGQTRLHGLDFGPHQMTCIHDLKAFWGRGAQVDVRAV